MMNDPVLLIVDYDMARVQKKCGDLADEKGFWDKGTSHNTPATQLMNMVGELSEAWEEMRKGHDIPERYYTDPFGKVTPHDIDPITGVVNKPEGVPSEMADTVVRIMDTCQHYGLDLAELIAEKLRYNKTRCHRHGGKVY
jgi:NTP pyrophosphatase (non-canonical NTP hydrolase)